MRFVGSIAFGQADDEHVRFDLDDASDRVIEGAHQHRTNLGARFGAGNVDSVWKYAPVGTIAGTSGGLASQILYRPGTSPRSSRVNSYAAFMS
jgi:hypothetical protein